MRISNNVLVKSFLERTSVTDKTNQKKKPLKLIRIELFLKV